MNVTTTIVKVTETWQGVDVRRAKLVITGLTAGAANTIPHGLPLGPLEVVYVSNSGAMGFETQAADRANLYFTTGAAQTSLTAYATY